jgi:translocation and assembly module TamB
VNVQLDKALVINLNDMHSSMSGEAILEGDLYGALIHGELNVDEFDLFLKGKKGALTHELDITYVNQPFEEPPLQMSSHNLKEWPLKLDLHLINSGTVSISDEQLTSFWKADATLTGTAEEPQMQGDCRLKSGDYLFNGKKFQLSQGTISFNGDMKKKTQLYVVGEQEVASILVEVIVKGPLNDLALAFRSTPQLSEKEILCRLLFGRGTDEITPFQGAELTESINKLKSHQGDAEPEFLSRLKKSFGIDRLDINHGGVDKEEISLQVGKYLSPSIFIGVTKGITSDAEARTVPFPLAGAATVCPNAVAVSVPENTVAEPNAMLPP